MQKLHSKHLFNFFNSLQEVQQFYQQLDKCSFFEHLERDDFLHRNRTGSVNSYKVHPIDQFEVYIRSPESFFTKDEIPNMEHCCDLTPSMLLLRCLFFAIGHERFSLFLERYKGERLVIYSVSLHRIAVFLMDLEQCSLHEIERKHGFYVSISKGNLRKIRYRVRHSYDWAKRSK